MKIKMTWVLLSAVLLATGTALAGQSDQDAHHERAHGGARQMHGMHDPARMVKHISRRLELDAAQAQELSNVVLAVQPQLTALHKKSRTNREAIAALDLDASDYAADIQRLALESGEIATERTLLMSQLRLDIHSRLTPEQQQKLADTTDHMRHRWREHGEERHRAHEHESEQ